MPGPCQTRARADPQPGFGEAAGPPGMAAAVRVRWRSGAGTGLRTSPAPALSRNGAESVVRRLLGGSGTWTETPSITGGLGALTSVLLT